MELAGRLQAAGTPWHFHMIGPNCRFGQAASIYALILENEASGEMFASHFSDRPMAQTQQMALLRYGPEFLKKEKNQPPAPVCGRNPSNPEFQKILEQARHCWVNKTAWHNHHLPPRCMLNLKAGSHCIVFEDETGGDPLYAYYEHDPVDELAELEQLLFAK